MNEARAPARKRWQVYSHGRDRPPHLVITFDTEHEAQQFIRRRCAMQEQLPPDVDGPWFEIVDGRATAQTGNRKGKE